MLRVGTVPYLVGRPVDRGLENEPGIQLSYEVPADLVAGLRSGRIDVALVSSIELFRQPGYRYLDSYCVAGISTVNSVQVFLKKPLAQVQSVALDPASRTAATLTQVVWPGAPGERPTFDLVAAGEDPRAAQADAWLRIGDVALREFLAPPSPDRVEILNPSQLWHEETGLPFVFAAWIVRPGVDVEGHAGAFVRARARGREEAEALAREASEAWSVPLEATRDYLLKECLYEPGERMTPTLLAFRDAAAPLGLCDGSLNPQPIRLI